MNLSFITCGNELFKLVLLLQEILIFTDMGAMGASMRGLLKIEGLSKTGKFVVCQARERPKLPLPFLPGYPPTWVQHSPPSSNW